MAELVLVRVDSRMIHGQVCTHWIGATRADRIILVDDGIYNDPILSQVLGYAAPQNLKFEIISTDMAAEAYKKDKFGNGRVIIIFQNIANAKDTYFKGFKYEELQIGGVEGGKPGKKVVHENISINNEEAESLKQIADEGCHIFFQMVPFSQKGELDSILKKHYPQILN